MAEILERLKVLYEKADGLEPLGSDVAHRRALSLIAEMNA